MFPLDQFQSELDYAIILFFFFFWSLKLLCVKFLISSALVIHLAGSMVGISEALSSVLS